MKRLFYFVFFANCLLPTANCFSQGTWVQKANLPGTARLTAVAFSIGNKGYLGTGSVGFGSSVPDFWEYNPATNSWTQKANFGGGNRGFACGFSIGNKGYIGTGLNNTTYYNDFWEYDPATNIWTQKASVSATLRWCAVAFAVNGKGYIGMGNDQSYVAQQDIWEYDPVANSWTSKANYIGVRCDVDRAAFVIGSKAYCGTGGNVGSTPSRNYNDFWEYDPAANSWTQKVNYPGNKRYGATGFSIFGKGYLGLGEDSLYNFYNDFWQYDPVANSWTADAAFPNPRCDAPSFVIGCKAYVGTGSFGTSPFVMYKDLWEFSPAGIGTLTVTSTSTVICTGSSVTLSASGGSTYTWNNGSTTSSIVVTPVSSATFIVSDSSSCPISGSITVNVVPQPTVTVSGNNSICIGSSATLTASGGNNYSWNNGMTTSSIIISPTANSTYSVIATAGSCTAAATDSVIVSQPPVANINCPSMVCSGRSTTLSASGGLNYSWSTNQTSSSITVSPTTNTTYSVIVSNGACDDTTKCTISVLTKNHISAYSNVTITTGSSATLNASGGILNYVWSNGSNDSTIIVSPSVTTIYCVSETLTVCSDTACVTVTVKPPEPIDCSFSSSDDFFIPNAFSPNGDNDNDVLKLYFKNIACITTYQFTVYNRWGEKIFETTDPAAVWDGSYKGSMERSAVFVYYMKATLITGDEVVKKGNISLVR